MREIIPPTVNGAKSGVNGMLSHFHYNVRAKGPNRDVRRACLTKVYQTEFQCPPTAPNYEYVQEFGSPRSRERFMKIFNIINSNLDTFGSNTSNAWINCLDKWEEDIIWFVAEFGVAHNIVLEDH